ncbi:polyketide synthase dehydratase domain-containing protein, partial [Kitasatospora sp. NPDC056531]|uniref:polyketide synthase dehydratase domain-containing protein n=1 Tax=Kitasatospora sp. NPDC056531 TaxID=3345856 RepID=UPI00369D7554
FAVLDRRRGEGRSFREALSGVHVHGTPVAWPVTGPRADLPTYPFQQRSYWLNAPRDTDAAPGQTATGHPLLGAAIDLADTASTVFTGNLSLATHPWLADHTVAGTVLLPGTAMLDLVLHAGTHVGCTRVEEMTLHTPLVLAEDASVDLRVTVGEPESDGGRQVMVHSRPLAESGSGTWVRHATATVTAAPAVTVEPTAVWPPVGATAMDPNDVYPLLDARGYQYGPAFQGLTGYWVHGDDILTEVAMPDQGDAAGFGIHPALLDAAMHPLGLETRGGGVALPFSWNGVQLHATGATALRVRLQRKGEAVAVTATDLDGNPVLTADSLVLRPLPAGELGLKDRSRDPLLQIRWQPHTPSEGDADREPVLIGTELGGHRPFCPDLAGLLRAVDGGASVPETVLLHCAPTEDPLAAPEHAHAVTRQVLEALQQWLSDARFERSTLVVVTRGAVSVNGGEAV